MFVYPSVAHYGKTVPKTKIYGFARPTRRVRDLFVSQVAEMVWKFKLAPETVRLPAGAGVAEIEVFELWLKTGELDERVLKAIDQAIKHPIFYEIRYENSIRHAAAGKRPSEADRSQRVIEAYFYRDWIDLDQDQRLPLPVATHLGTLYQQMLRPMIPLPARAGESLGQQVGRYVDYHRKSREAEQLKKRRDRELQFNRKVELNAQLRELRSELKQLQS